MHSTGDGAWKRDNFMAGTSFNGVWGSGPNDVYALLLKRAQNGLGRENLEHECTIAARRRRYGSKLRLRHVPARTCHAVDLRDAFVVVVADVGDVGAGQRVFNLLHALIGLRLSRVRIDSPYLARGTERKFCELVLWLGIDPECMSEAVLDGFVEWIDGLCSKRGAFRYMHTRTSTDKALRARVDPNSQYSAADEGVRGLWNRSASSA